jgi:hypothetical protein
MKHSWTCSCCGTQFDTLPLDYVYRAPDQWFQIPESEREQRSKLSSDVCIIDRRDFFVRGCLEIPIIGQDKRFIWGVWVSVSRASFIRIHDLWDEPVVENEPPMPGLLCNDINDLYPTTLDLKILLRLRGDNKRPAIELESTDHPLAVEQRQGIPIERVEEIAALSFEH